MWDLIFVYYRMIKVNIELMIVIDDKLMKFFKKILFCGIRTSRQFLNLKKL